MLDWPPRLVPGYSRLEHLRALADAFARASIQGDVRECFSTFPRAGKTETVIAALVRALWLKPERTNAFIGYSAELAEEKSRRIRDLVEQAGVKLRGDSKRLGHWHTAKGGGLIAVGIGGPLVGMGIDGVAVVDDLYRNRGDAESPAIRAEVESWFSGSLLTRLQHGGSVIVCSARWTPRDLIGVLAEDAGWPYTAVPALGPDGESVFPAMWPTAELRRREIEVGPADWASLYMGQPRPPGGAVFEGEPHFFAPTMDNIQGRVFLMACDPAATISTRADYSVILVGAVRRDEHNGLELDVWDVQRLRCEVPDLAPLLLRTQHEWQAAVTVVECCGAFIAVEQALRRLAPELRIRPLKGVGTSKFVRAQPAAGLWRAGKIRLLRGASWVPTFVAEVMGFTGSGGSEKDDQVDALSHLVNHAQTALPVECDVDEIAAQIARGLPHGGY